MLIEYINMKNNEMMRLVLIVVAACVFILIHSYNNTNNVEQENFFADAENTGCPSSTTAIILLKAKLMY